MLWWLRSRGRNAGTRRLGKKRIGTGLLPMGLKAMGSLIEPKWVKRKARLFCLHAACSWWAHCVHNGLRTLELLQIELSHLSLYAIIHTLELAQDMFETMFSLGDLVAALDQKEAFRCAANDAHFTMQALLAMWSRKDDECRSR